MSNRHGSVPDGPCVCDAAGSPGVSRCLLTCPRREQQPDPTRPRASVIEIIAKDYRPTEDGPGSIIIPREVRINGVSVYTANGNNDGIKISDIRLGDNLVTVNLTLIARRLTIAADGDLNEETP